MIWKFELKMSASLPITRVHKETASFSVNSIPKNPPISIKVTRTKYKNSYIKSINLKLFPKLKSLIEVKKNFLFYR